MAAQRVVVVGCGLAGSVVAERLSRDPDREVIVLERGDGGADPDVLTLPDEQPDSAVTWWPTSAGAVPRGMGVGGSGAINGATWMPWHKDDLSRLEDIDAEAALVASEQCGVRAVSPRSPITAAAERYWELIGFGIVGGPWAAVGCNRVATTSQICGAQWHRRIGLPQRGNLQVHTGVAVRSSADLPDADEVIVCAGTFGTAELLWKLDAVASSELPLGEHREQLVTYAVREPVTPGHLVMESVLHTDDGLEMRPYTVPFGDRFAIGVADMAPGTVGALTRSGAGTSSTVAVNLGAPDRGRLGNGCAAAVDMLRSNEFRDLVVPESVRVEPTVGTSQHACATLLPQHGLADSGGYVTDWLRVMDASILPLGASGPAAMLSVVAAVRADH